MNTQTRDGKQAPVPAAERAKRCVARLRAAGGAAKNWKFRSSTLADLEILKSAHPGQTESAIVAGLLERAAREEFARALEGQAA